MKQKFIFIFLVVVSCWSCKNDQAMFDRDYPIVETLEPLVSESGVILRGEFVAFGEEEISQAGFRFIGASSELGEVIVQWDRKSRNFSFDLRSGIPKDVTFYVQSIAVTENFYSQGNIMEFTSMGFQPNPVIIYSFGPAEVWPDDTLYITGNDFGLTAGDISMKLGEVPCSLLHFSIDSLAFRIPQMPGGVYDGSVFKGNTPSTFGPITVKAPYIKHFKPATGYNGTMVWLYGEGLGEVQEVMLGTEPCEVVNNWTDSLTFYVYNAVPGGSVPVWINVNEQRINAPEEFTFVNPDPLTITGMAPGQGAPGDRITITGTGLRQNDMDPAVIFGDALYADVVFSHNEQIEFIVPVMSSGIKTVRVRSFNEVATAGNFEILEPEITGISPSEGYDSTIVTVSGRGLTIVASIQMAGQSCFFWMDDYILHFMSPFTSVSGIQPVRIYGPDSELLYETSFNILAHEVTGMDKTEGYPGDALIITGKSFIQYDRKSDVLIGGQYASLLSVTTEEIICTIPDIIPGETNVTVRNGRKDVLAGAFNILGN